MGNSLLDPDFSVFGDAIMEGEMRDREQMRELDVREYLSSVLPQLADLADTVEDEGLQMLAVQLRLAADNVKTSRQIGLDLH